MDGVKRVAAQLAGKEWYRWAALASLWAIVFVPHLLNSGFVSDDWSVARSGAAHVSFWERFVSWFPLFSNRPAAPLVLSLFSQWFGAESFGYLVANLTIWLASLILVGKVLLRFLSVGSVTVFLALAAFPSIASTVLFSIGMQLVGVSSILLWAISLYLLDRYLERRGLFCLFSSYLFVLLSLLVYEISLPLVVLNVLYPLLFDGERRPLRFALRHLLPVFLLILGILVLQKVVMPHFMPVYSRLSPGSLGNSLAVFCSWGWALLVDFPLLLVDGWQRIFVSHPNEVSLEASATAVAALCAYLLFGFNRPGADGSPALAAGNGRRGPALLCIALLALLSASLLFILSGSGPQVGGYLNRGLTSSWVLLALVVAVFSELSRGRVQTVVVCALVVLNACSFMLQRENYAVSWQLQNEIARSVVTRLKEAGADPTKSTVLGHVPSLVPSSYNGEEVFQNFWDFSGALWLADPGFPVNAMPLAASQVPKLEVKPEGVRLNYWQSDYANLWFYEYHARFGTSRLVRVTGPAVMKGIAEEVQAAKFNSWPASVPLRVRDAVYSGFFFALVLALATLAAARLLPPLGARKPGGEVRPTPGTCCRVCGGTLFSRIKESDISESAVSSADFRVTDSSYGATGALERCAGCGFLQSPCSEVLQYYQQMEDPEYESGRLARSRQFSDLLDEVALWTGGRFLDVGAGSGILVEQALQRGQRAEGIEPSQWMARQAASRGLPVVAGVLPDPRVRGPFSAVTLVDVIEHVSNPCELLQEIGALLEPGGYLLLTTPDVDSLAARIMGERWWHFRIAHISYFTPKTIDLLLQRCGFEVVKSKRTGWYFEFSYLFERLMQYIPGTPSLPLPERVAKTIIPLNLYDSMLLVCRKKP